MLTAALFPILIPLACFLLLAVCWPLRHNGKLAGAISCAAAIASCFGALRLLNLVMSGEVGAADGFSQTFPWLVANGNTIARPGRSQRRASSVAAQVTRHALHTPFTA